MTSIAMTQRMKQRVPESATLRACLDLLVAERIWHRRWNTGAVKTEGRFFRFGQNGDADILAVPRLSLAHNANPLANVSGTAWFATPLWIEVKSDRGQQTNAQELFEAEVKREGHYYLLVRDVDELREWLKAHGVIR